MEAVLAGARPIGVLDLQGGVHEHLDHLHRIKVAARTVKSAADLAGLAGLIIPGGESTCLSRLLAIFGLDAAIKAHYRQGLKLWGTCAGAILLAQEQLGERPCLGLIDITVSRNNTTRNLYIGLSQTVEPFTKPKVREALKYLVDYKGMTESLLKGEFTVLQSFWPAGFDASLGENPYTYDVEKAKALLAEAGYKDGFSFKLSVRNVSPAIDMAQALKSIE